MPWLLPVPMLLVVMLIMLALVPTLARRPSSDLRLVVEMSLATHAVAALAWAFWHPLRWSAQDSAPPGAVTAFFRLGRVTA